MVKFILYLIVVPLVIFVMDSININVIFKKNKVYQARILYILLVFSLSYLVTNFLYDFIYCLK
ncbi:MAG: DUF1146 family protein [Bacilli bacterium]